MISEIIDNPEKMIATIIVHLRPLKKPMVINTPKVKRAIKIAIIKKAIPQKMFKPVDEIHCIVSM